MKWDNANATRMATSGDFGLAVRQHPLALAIRAAVAGCSIAAASVAWAGPTGGVVVGGQGGVGRPDAHTTVVSQHSSRMAINWQSFNVDASELVRFDQPNAQATALNRILDQNPSQILGRVQANGRIVLLNPNGIVFGRNSTVNAAGIVAAAQDASPSAFMESGKLDLATVPGADGAVVNQGTLAASTGGGVALSGRTVSNEGLIVAQRGTVALAAGDQTTIDFDGDGLLQVAVGKEVAANPTGADAAVSNAGTIDASGGQVVMTAGAARDVFSRVVVNSGTVTAGRIDTSGGTIRLVAAGDGAKVVNTGTLDASGQGAADGGSVEIAADNIEQAGVVKANGGSAGNGGAVTIGAGDTALLSGESSTTASAQAGNGGRVVVTGERVGLVDHAAIDVSGAFGGGQAFIGGGARGADPGIRNAAFAYLGADTLVAANASESGDGGQIAIWSEHGTRNYGHLSARGGAVSGNGGLIETSGHDYLDVNGTTIDVAATSGNGGTWLIDPVSISIVAGAGPNVGVPSVPPFTPNPGGIAATIFNGTINSALTGGATVRITTDTGDADPLQQGTGAGDIDVQANITGVGSATLELVAAGNITLQNNVAISTAVGSTLNVTMVANDQNSTQNDPDSSAGNVIFNANSSVNTRGGTFSATGETITLNGSITTGNGAASLTANSGAIAVNNVISAGSGTVSLTATNGSITDSGSGAVTAAGLKMVSNTGATLDLTTHNVGTLAGNITGTGNFVYVDSDGFGVGSVGGTVGITTNDGNISLKATTSDLNVAQTVTAGGTSSVILEATAGNVTDSGSGAITAAGLKVVAATGATLDLTTHDVDTLAGEVTGTGSFVYVDSDGFGIGTIGSTVGVTTDDGNISLKATTSDLNVAQTVTAGGTSSVILEATAAKVTDSGSGAITAEGLNVIAATGATLDLTTHDVDTLAGEVTGTGSFVYVDSDGFGIGTIGSTVGVTTDDGNISLEATTGDLNVAQTVTAGETSSVILQATGANVTDSGSGAITAAGLKVVAATGATLDLTTHNVDTLAGNLNGSGNFTFVNTDGFSVGAVDGTSGVSTSNGDIALTATTGTLDLAAAVDAGGQNVTLSAGTVSQSSGGVTAGGLKISAASAAALESESNNVSALSASVLNVPDNDDGFKFTNAGSFTVGSVAGLDGITTNGHVRLKAETGNLTLDTDVIAGATKSVFLQATAGNVTQSGGHIAGANLRVIASTGATLEQPSNDVNTLATSITGTGNFSFVDADGFTVGEVSGFNGVRTNNGTISLKATTGNLVVENVVNAGTSTATLEAMAGSVTDSGSGAITAGDLKVVAASGVVLDLTTHDVDTLAGNLTGNGDFKFVDSDGFSVDTVGGTDGVSTTNGNISLTASSNDLELKKSVSAGTGSATFLQATAGSVTQTAGHVTAGNLRVIAAGGATLQSASNDVDTLAANISGAGNFEFTDADGFTVGTVSGTSGVTTQDGAITLEATTGDLELATAVRAGGGKDVILRATGGSITQSAGGITADVLNVGARNSADLVAGTNNISTLRATVTHGGLSVKDASNDLTISNVTVASSATITGKGGLSLATSNIAPGSVKILTTPGNDILYKTATQKQVTLKGFSKLDIDQSIASQRVTFSSDGANSQLVDILVGSDGFSTARLGARTLKQIDHDSIPARIANLDLGDVSSATLTFTGNTVRFVVPDGTYSTVVGTSVTLSSADNEMKGGNYGGVIVINGDALWRINAENPLPLVSDDYATQIEGGSTLSVVPLPGQTLKLSSLNKNGFFEALASATFLKGHPVAFGAWINDDDNNGMAATLNHANGFQASDIAERLVVDHSVTASRDVLFVGKTIELSSDVVVGPERSLMFYATGSQAGNSAGEVGNIIVAGSPGVEAGNLGIAAAGSLLNSALMRVNVSNLLGFLQGQEIERFEPGAGSSLPLNQLLQGDDFIAIGNFRGASSFFTSLGSGGLGELFGQVSTQNNAQKNEQRTKEVELDTSALLSGIYLLSQNGTGIALPAEACEDPDSYCAPGSVAMRWPVAVPAQWFGSTLDTGAARGVFW